MKNPILFLALMAGLGAGAQNKILTSKVELEFESSPDAKSYQIEIKQGEQTILSKESATASYILDLAPGKYEIRTRAKDKRGVFGAWSPADSIQVDPPGVQLKPEHGRSKAMDPQNPYEPISFSWPEMPMAVAYVVKVKNEKSEVVAEKKLSTNKAEFVLAPGRYVFNVQVEYADQVVSLPSSFEPSLVVGGTQIPPPVIKWSENKDGEKIARWKIPDGILLKVKLEYSAFMSEQWSLVADHFEKNEINISQLRPPGKYRLSLQAEAKGWTSASPRVEEFEVKPQEPELDY